MTNKVKKEPLVDMEARMAGLAAKTISLENPLDVQHHLNAQDQARAHDRIIESLRTTRATKDRDRMYPRLGQGEVRPRRGRHALHPDEPRIPFSRNQASAEQRAKRAAQNRMPKTEGRALSRLLNDQDHWDDLNVSLSSRTRAHGDLTPEQAQAIGRIDRAIRRFETHNDRSHRVYTGLQVHDNVNINALQPGATFTFDQYTGADHSPHKISADTLLEITGSRGIYLGDGKGDNTQHLLPRGITIAIDAVHDSDVISPDGITRRRIVQAHIIEQES